MRRVLVALLAVAGRGLLVGVGYSDGAMRQAEAAYPPVGAYVAVDGARLRYVEAGAGPPVVLVHGSGGVLQDYTTSILRAVAREHRALAYDRPGHGYSERPPNAPLTLGLNARLLHAALDALGVERPVLVGHSYGGAVALQYALDYPDSVSGVAPLAGAAYPGGGLPHPRVVMPALPLVGPLYLHALLMPLDRLAARVEIERTGGAETDSAAWPETRSGAGSAPPAYAAPARALGTRPAQFAADAEEMRAVNADLAVLAPRYATLRATRYPGGRRRRHCAARAPRRGATPDRARRAPDRAA